MVFTEASLGHVETTRQITHSRSPWTLRPRRGSAGQPVARFAAQHEIEQWDALIDENPDGGSVWRGRAYAEGERIVGFVPVYLIVDGIACTAMEKRLPLLGRTWHLPAGPGALDVDSLLRFTKALTNFAAAQGVFTLRIEPQIRDNEPDRRRLLDAGFRPSHMWSPQHTVLVDLTGSEADVLSRFSQSTRRWIKRSARDGVVVDRVEASDENCRQMHELLTATADKRFPIRNLAELTATYQGMQAAGNGQLFFARFEEALVAGAFMMKVGRSALYLNGASVRKEEGQSKENGLGAHGVGHAVQWEAMRWAREFGATRYDLCGAPSAANADDPAEPLYGVGKFKRTFDKEIVDYIGCYDVPVRRIRSEILYQQERVLLAMATSGRFGWIRH